MKRGRPAGFSLMEVLLASSILLGCLIVLGELSYVGRKHAESSQDLSTAQLLCQSKLNELLAGALPVEPVQSQPLDDNLGWLYSVELAPAGRLGLTAVRVTVAKDDSGRAQALQDAKPPKHFTLVRWARDLNRGTSSPRTYSRPQTLSVESPPPPKPVLYGGRSR